MTKYKYKFTITDLIMLSLCLLALGSMMGTIFGYSMKEEKCGMMCLQSANEWADYVEEKCGSTFLVKNPQYWEGIGAKPYWTVFKSVCKSDGYCKYEYIKLEDCLMRY